MGIGNVLSSRSLLVLEVYKGLMGRKGYPPAKHRHIVLGLSGAKIVSPHVSLGIRNLFATCHAILILSVQSFN